MKHNNLAKWFYAICFALFFAIRSDCLPNDNSQQDQTLETVLNMVDGQFKLVSSLAWRVEYKKTWERDGGAIIRYRSSFSNYPPEDLASEQLKKPTLVIYCAGYFKENAAAVHYVESLIKDGHEDIERNKKYIFDGHESRELSFPPSNTIGEALAEGRPPSAELKQEGFIQGYPPGEGAPLNVLIQCLGFGGDAKQLAGDRMRSFFARAKNISVKKGGLNIIQVTALFPAGDSFEYTFDLNRGGMITKWTEKTSSNAVSVVTFNYIEVAGQGGIKLFVPHHIEAKTSFLDKEGEHLMSRKIYDFPVLEPMPAANFPTFQDADYKELSWETIKGSP